MLATMNNHHALVVFCTVPSTDQANAFASELVREGLAACAKVITNVISHYRWDGTLQRDSESQLIIKTSGAKFDELSAWITEHHPYEVPELLGVPVTHGSSAYLQWITDALADERAKSAD